MTDDSSPEIEAPRIREELIEMKEEARRTRRSLETDDDGRVDDADALEEVRAMEERHADRLEAIIDELGGWPDHEVVGEAGSNAAHFVALHTDHDVPFQERCLKLMEEALEAGRESAPNYAYLADRIRINRDERQLYGTHLTVEDGRVEAFPIEDRDHLGQRRDEMGLQPFETYVEEFEATLEET